MLYLLAWLFYEDVGDNSGMPFGFGEITFAVRRFFSNPEVNIEWKGRIALKHSSTSDGVSALKQQKFYLHYVVNVFKEYSET